MKPAFRLSDEELQAEREKWHSREAKREAAPKAVIGNVQTSGLHFSIPRISLGGGAYKIDTKAGQVWGR